MNDIQFISFVDLITVDYIELDSSNSLQLYVVVSPIASYISTVTLNEIPVDTFTILSSNTIKVTFPGSLNNNYHGLRDLSLSELDFKFTTSVLTAKRNTEIVFSPGSTRVQSLSGIQKLVQHVIKLLLSSKGSNRWDPRLGTLFMDSIGETVNIADISADLIDSLKSIKDNIVEDQIIKTLPDDEKLAALRLIDLTEGADSITAKIFLATAAGSNYAIPIAI